MRFRDTPASNMNLFFEDEPPLDHDNLHFLQHRQDRHVALVANGWCKFDHLANRYPLDFNDLACQWHFNDTLTSMRHGRHSNGLSLQPPLPDDRLLRVKLKHRFSGGPRGVERS